MASLDALKIACGPSRVGITLLISCLAWHKGQLKVCMRIMCIIRKRRGTRERCFSASSAALSFIWIFSSPGLAYARYGLCRFPAALYDPNSAGWVAKPYSAGGASGVTIVHGADAYVQIFLQKGIDPATFLQALNNEIQNTHAGYRVSDRGLRTIAGQPRIYIVGEAPGTSGAPRTRVYLETFAANGFSYAVIASSSGNNPQSPQSISDYKISQAMIQSLTLNGVPAKTLMAAGASLATAAAPAGSRGRFIRQLLRFRPGIEKNLPRLTPL